MTAIRWRQGLVLRSVADHLHAGLTALEWFDDPNPWLGTALIWDADHDTEAAVSGESPPEPNTVGVSLGDVPDNTVQELGGGLASVSIPLFVDIYGESRSVARNIGDDIQQILQGEVWSGSRYVPMYDYAQSPKVLLTDQSLEAKLVESHWAPGATSFRRPWRVVNATCTLWFVGGGND